MSITTFCSLASRAGALLLISVLSTGALAHNNPTLVEQSITHIQVTPDTTASAPFSLHLPKRAIQLIWRIQGADGASFTLQQNGSSIATDLQHETTTGRLQGDGFTITDVQAASGPFTVEVIAKVAQTDAQTASSQDDSKGLEVYRKANCMGCHKWHGGGGGGYGGAALSLRTTGLDADAIKLVVRCGRPNSGMPYHERSAYRGESRDCYGVTKKELGKTMPSRARTFLREQQIDQVVAYVVNQLQGRGEPTYEECLAFWGKDARQCDVMKPQ